MIWIIGFVISLVIFVVLVRTYADELSIVFAAFSSFILFILSICALAKIYEYPKLLAKKAQIEVLEKNITTIKETIDVNGPDGSFKDIRNFKHSTAVAEYMGKLAELKAEYEKDLQYCKYMKSSTLHIIIDGSCFISDKIYDL